MKTKNKNRILKIEASLLAGLLIACILNISSFSEECKNIRTKMLRMHIIANSDSTEDQELKLKVRDAVLLEGKEIFDGSVTAEEAKDKILPETERLRQAALKVIEQEGFNYDVKITVDNEYFNTRTYDNSVTLPAGYYTAIKVIIGEGAGHNWWCVMFPPLCLPTASKECELSDVLEKDEVEIVEGGDKYKFKFKIVEIYEKITEKLK
ncbi:MAG: stage II sporulation protein R [Oscillospiraceae bacterium]|nr:stage II sporulation protein R [Oscillospiraceae bacterium]